MDSQSTKGNLMKIARRKLSPTAVAPVAVAVLTLALICAHSAMAQNAAAAAASDDVVVKGAVRPLRRRGPRPQARDPGPGRGQEEVLALRRAQVPDAGVLRRHAPPHRQLRRCLHGRRPPDARSRPTASRAAKRWSPRPACRRKLSRPLDFLVVTDHAEGLGVMYQVYEGNPAFMSDPTLARWGKAMKAGGKEAGDDDERADLGAGATTSCRRRSRTRRSSARS